MYTHSVIQDTLFLKPSFSLSLKYLQKSNTDEFLNEVQNVQLPKR